MEVNMLYDEIRNALKQKMAEGMTQDELAKKAGVSRSHICHLKNGSRSIGGISLETLLKLFPHATIHLNGDTISGTATSTNGIAVVGNHFSGSVAHTPECKEKLDAISGAVLDPDIPDDAKIKVLKIIKEVR